MQAHLNSREDCLAAERQDALGAYKARFALPPGVLYMDGNSLGPLPHAAKERARQVIEEEWGQGLIRSWNQAGWFELPVRLGDKLARLLGAGPGELAVTDTTSINLFKALAAALDISTQQHPGRKVILSEKDNFPTDLYMAQGLAQLLQQGHELRLVDETLSLEQVLDETVAVLLLSHVNYRSGAMHDMRAITQKAHDCGALVIWDLAHSAGAVPVDLHAAEADFAVGCTYKYLNAGPGAPAFIWAAARHAGRFHQPLSGWWSHEAPFAMRPGYAPATGAKHLLCGTQPMISLALVECGLDIALEAGMGAVRRKSLELGDLFIRLVQTRCAGHDLELVTPLEHARRGSHVSFAHPQGHAIMQALIARGVIGDYREPHILRFGLTPLYFGYSDVWDAVEILRNILDTRAWDEAQFHQRQAVT